MRRVIAHDHQDDDHDPDHDADRDPRGGRAIDHR
jgi:hypothetical protein